ncbi:RNA polymerase sigma factor [Actinomadura napierensis]|uniref:RNA polymerase sigma factor n=1 Tax=Actinomadura napierensis TaxID=267854 RepID=A0ABN3A282_9ACTN
MTGAPSETSRSTGPEPSDADVITAARRNPERFADLFDRHYAQIHRYVDRRLGADAADDIAAETFLIAFRRRAAFDTAHASARPWLYGIATRLISRHRRDELRRYRAMARMHTADAVESHESSVTSAVAAASLGLSPALAGLQRARPMGAFSDFSAVVSIGVEPVRSQGERPATGRPPLTGGTRCPSRPPPPFPRSR